MTLPPGLEDAADLGAIQQMRIESMQQATDAIQSKIEQGLENSQRLLQAHRELINAKLDATTTSHERLEILADGFRSALLTWQRVKELQQVGARGTEAQARAEVFRYQVMRLEEKAKEGSGPKSSDLKTSPQQDIPKDVGTGLLPPGLVNDTDLVTIKQTRIDALKQTAHEFQRRYEVSPDSMVYATVAQMELTIARLDATNIRQERLACIQDSLRTACLVWQRVKDLQSHGMRGGDGAAEAVARAEAFRYRSMWLNEKASEPK